MAESHSSVTQANKTSANHIAAESMLTNHSHSPEPAASSSLTSHITADSTSTNQSCSVPPVAARRSPYVCHI